MDLILKGFIIGIGKIIPGVSGSSLAITLGIYEEILKRISNLKNEIKNKSTYLIKIGIGIIVAIGLISKIIVKCLNKYYLATMLLFIGLIIGGLPSLIKKAKIKKVDYIIITIITTILIMISLKMKVEEHTLTKTPIEIIRIIGVGIIDSASSIIPGISGTALLMSIGYYKIIINTFSTLYNFNNIETNIFILLPFMIGFIIGTITISKIITYLIKKYRKKTYIAIISFSLLSTTMMIKNINYKKIEIIKRTPIMVIGYIISRKFEK